MRKIGLVLLGIAAGLLILLPAFLYLLAFMDSSLQFGYTRFFKEVYFTIVPGIALVGAGFFFQEKLTATEKDRFVLKDYLWTALFFGSLLLYILVFIAAPDSIFNRMGNLIPPVHFLAPEWNAFLLWISFFLVLVSSIMLYRSVQRLRWDKNRSGALMIGLLLSVFFSLMMDRFPLMRNLESTFESEKYSLMRNPANSLHPPSGLRYCRAPYDDSGETVTTFAPNPEGVRDDIEIIGIATVTFEKIQGAWPLDFGVYANIVDNLAQAERSVTLFDISFQDDKGIHGGSACGVTIKCDPLEGKPMPGRQTDILAKAIASSPQKIVGDFPIEATDDMKSKVANYQARLDILNERERLRNIKGGQLARVWAKLPVPPVVPIAEAYDGMGFANILKSDSGVNSQVPLVSRIVNTERSQQPDYNPDRDDYFYPGIDLVLAVQYYGIDLLEDVEVDFLKGVITLKNIPEVKYRKFDLETMAEQELDIMAKPNASRQIVIPIDVFGRMNINFRGGRYCFRYREILEVADMSPEEAGANYKNKIALVAMYYATGAGTAQDMHLGPYGDMAGIEHHAHAINTILNQDFAYTAPAWVNLLILLGIGLLMGMYQPRVPTGMSFVLALAIAVVFSGITLFVSFDLFSFHHVFPTVLILQFVQLVAFIGFRALTEEENVKFIRTTFSKFVSHDVVEELLANPEAISLGGSKKEISVFFSDVRGFTTISEALSPEGLVSLLNEYLSEMTELIIDYRGTIDKYMGDAIMAFWGAPARNDDHAYYACVAAIAQYRALQGLQKRWSERNIPVIDIGIGINTGLAVVGNMGSSRRMDYTLMGDTVNLGSRLEGITKTYGVKICISEFTYERVKDRVYARELDLVRVKGKLEPVRIYELMGLVNEADVESLKVSHSATPAKG